MSSTKGGNHTCAFTVSAKSPILAPLQRVSFLVLFCFIVVQACHGVVAAGVVISRGPAELDQDSLSVKV